MRLQGVPPFRLLLHGPCSLEAKWKEGTEWSRELSMVEKIASRRDRGGVHVELMS